MKLSRLAVTVAKNSAFDLDFSYGRKGETLVEELMTGGYTVEVKRDRKWAVTNNLYIETRCYYVSSGSWEASGLAVTEADYWAFVLESSVLMIRTPVLRFATAEYGRPITCDIPPNKSSGYLITVEDLMMATRKVRPDGQ